MRLASAAVAIFCLTVAGCGGDKAAPTAAEKFAVMSPAFADNARIPAEYSCHGDNAPPPLRWENVPAGTESLALVVDDPDAPAGPYVHWVVTGIAPTTSGINDGAPPQGATVGRNSAGEAQYFGPCPPAGTGVHHYRFQLYSLDTPVPPDPAAPAPEAARNIADTATAVARTVGVFGD